MAETHHFLNDLPAMQIPETPHLDNTYFHGGIADNRYQEADHRQTGEERIQVMLDSTLIGIRHQLTEDLYNIRRDIELQVRSEQIQVGTIYYLSLV